MMFLESPSLFAPLSTWEAWAKRLNTFNPHDKTVVAEKERTKKMIALLKEPVEITDESIPA